MQDVLDVAHRDGPALVLEQVGGDEAEGIRAGQTGFREGLADGLFAGQIPDGGPHRVTLLDELENAVPGDETRAAGDQNC